MEFDQSDVAGGLSVLPMIFVQSDLFILVPLSKKQNENMNENKY